MQGYEQFTESQIKTLERFVSNTSGNVFVLHNLPEVIKGALFSRYSRSNLGLRTLLLKDFIANEEMAFESIVGKVGSAEEQGLAIRKAQSFYDRILDGYGDDSIGELGGAHLAIENISIIAAKIIEDHRIGGSPLEKSTRYIYFDQKVNGEYLFHREVVLMTSAYRDLYVSTCNKLFEVYSKLIPPLTLLMESRFPKEPEVSKIAYAAAIRAKVLDCLRGLLPASTLTNMGVFGNGRFFESLIRKMQCHNLGEICELGSSFYEELSKTMPSFVRRADPAHPHQKLFVDFWDTMNSHLNRAAEVHQNGVDNVSHSGVKLVSWDPESVNKVAAALFFPYSDRGLAEWQQYCKRLPEAEILRLFEGAAHCRQNRRHKSPRALEHATFTFEIIADYGVYRDLQRHRMLTQERQMLTCRHGYHLPKELEGTELEQEYCSALEEAAEAYEKIAKEFPEEAQYIVPMAYNIRWYFHVNLRALQWLCELRSSPAGHPRYRYIAQELARQTIAACPAFECFFKYVDYEGYELGRLGAEQRTLEKNQARVG